MALDLANYERKTDQGERAGVTAGKNMDGFLDLISSLVRRNGAGKGCFRYQLRGRHHDTGSALYIRDLA